MFQFLSQCEQKGYVTLLSVLVVGAVGLAISVSLILLGNGASRTSFANEQSNQAKALANACVETALQQIRDADGYSGSGNLTIGQGTCVYTVLNTGGTTRTINASGMVGTIVRKVAVLVTELHPLVTLASWQEVAD